MSNAFDDMRAAVEQAAHVNAAVDANVTTMLRLLHGRLRYAAPDQLARIKRELRDFNMHTKEWKT